jgi:hypothetical protein
LEKTLDLPPVGMSIFRAILHRALVTPGQNHASPGHTCVHRCCSASAPTTEYLNGKPQRVVQRFRSYDSYDDAMNDYASVLKANPRYAQVLSGSHDLKGFASGMQRAGYSTDPHYAQKLIQIIQKIG